MDDLVEAIEIAINTENYYAALFLSLTLPDICGNIEYPELSKKSDRYKEWFRINMTPKYIINNKVSLLGDDCYALRCSMLHEGNSSVESQSSHILFKKFIFGTFQAHKSCFFDCDLSGQKWDAVIELSVNQFCKDMCESARDWLNGGSFTEEQQEKMKSIITIYPPGTSFGGLVIN